MGKIKGHYEKKAKLRFVEHHIAPGDKIYVIGTVSSFSEDGISHESGSFILRAGEKDGSFFIFQHKRKFLQREIAKKVMGQLILGSLLLLSLWAILSHTILPTYFLA
jgi:hypothetical protein